MQRMGGPRGPADADDGLAWHARTHTRLGSWARGRAVYLLQASDFGNDSIDASRRPICTITHTRVLSVPVEHQQCIACDWRRADPLPTTGSSRTRPLRPPAKAPAVSARAARPRVPPARAGGRAGDACACSAVRARVCVRLCKCGEGRVGGGVSCTEILMRVYAWPPRSITATFVPASSRISYQMSSDACTYRPEYRQIDRSTPHGPPGGVGGSDGSARHAPWWRTVRWRSLPY
jgi:hypothetical protein